MSQATHQKRSRIAVSKCKLVPTPMTSQRIYEEAEKIIHGSRRTDYGAVEKSFKRIALTWSAVLDVDVTPEQVALCMMGLKICREANSHSVDSLVDICGYTGLLAELRTTKGYAVKPA